jgi:hypothetical protein
MMMLCFFIATSTAAHCFLGRQTNHQERRHFHPWHKTMEEFLESWSVKSFGTRRRKNQSYQD